MLRIITQGFPVALLALACVLVAPSAFADNKALDVRMKALGGSLKDIKSTLKKIRGTTGAHEKEWASAKSNAEVMAKASDEAKTLYPDHIKGDTAKEKGFRDALVDVNKSITEKLIKALTQKELDASEKAVKEIEKKRNAAHGQFMPPKEK